MMVIASHKIPPSKGLFRRDVYEKAVRIVQQFPPTQSPYRAFGESLDGKRSKRAIRAKATKAVAHSK